MPPRGLFRHPPQPQARRPGSTLAATSIGWGDWSSTFSNVVSAEAYALEGVDFTTQPTDDLSVQSWAVQPLAAAAFNPASGFPWNQDAGELFYQPQCWPDPTTDLAVAFGAAPLYAEASQNLDEGERFVASQVVLDETPGAPGFVPLNADRALAFNQPQDASASPVDDDTDQAWSPIPPAAAVFDPASGFPWAREGGEVQAERVQDDTPQGWPPGPAWGTYSSTFSNLVSAEAYAIEGGEVAAQPTVDPSVQTYAIQPPAAAAFNPGTGFPWDANGADTPTVDQNVPEPDLGVEFGTPQFDPSAGTAWNQDEGERFVQSYIVGEDWQAWAVQPPAVVVTVNQLTAFNGDPQNWQAEPGSDPSVQSWAVGPPQNATQALAFNQPEDEPYATVDDPTVPALSIQPPPYIPVFQATAFTGDPDNWQQVPLEDPSVQSWAVQPPLNADRMTAWSSDFTTVAPTTTDDDTSQSYSIQPVAAAFDPSTVTWTGRDDIVQPVWQVQDDTAPAWTPSPPPSPAAFSNEHPDEPPFP